MVLHGKLLFCTFVPLNYITFLNKINMTGFLNMGKQNRIDLQKVALNLSVAKFSWQDTEIEGVVIDERTQAQIVEACVSLSGQGSVSTDNDGNFTIFAKSFPATVSVSFLGYQTVELEIYEYYKYLLQ
jgi:hypothetical protein